MPESHEEFARVSPIVSLQGGAKIVNNHPADPIGTLKRVARGIGAGGSVGARVRAVARILGDGKAMAGHAAAQCEASIRFAW